MLHKKLNTIEKSTSQFINSSSKKYLIHHEANYTPVSSIPTGNSHGLNYTFQNGNYVKKINQQSGIGMKQSNEQQKVSKKIIKKRNMIRSNTIDQSKQSKKINLSIDMKNSDNIELSSNKDTRSKNVSSRPSRKHLLTQPKAQEYSTDQDQEDQGEQYLQNSTPGPGSYQIDSIFKQSKKKKLFFNLSKQKKNNHLQNNPQQEDQQYEQIPIKKRQIKLRKIGFKKYFPFLSSALRFIEKPQPDIPAPNAYRPRDTIEEQLIKNLQRDVKGKFWQGKRFKSELPPNQIGPGHYQISPILQEDEKHDEPNYFFKSKVKREIFENSKNKKSLRSKTIVDDKLTKDINNKESKQKQISIKQIAFGRKIKDVQNNRRNTQPTDSLDYLSNNKKSLMELYEEMTPQKKIVKDNQTRHIIKIQNHPGPGYYETIIPKKKVYNIKLLYFD